MATSEEDKKDTQPSILPSASVDQAKERILAEAQAAELQEKARLQQLVEEAMGLKAKAPPVEEPPEAIEHIKSNAIKSMRKVSAEQINQKEPMADQLSQMAIKVICGFGSLFSFGKSKDHCIVKGHECMHCGQKIPFTGQE
jgi:hypothetical protein